MRFFPTKKAWSKEKGAPDPVPALPADAHRRTGRTVVYAVRVREGYKGEILNMQAELQLERQRQNCKARKVTEGEVADLMLSALKVMRRNGDALGLAVPIADDVWQGVHAIARRLGVPATDVIEQLVVQKVAELNLVPRR